MLWGAERLKKEVESKDLIEPYGENNYDGAAYRLSVSDEVYISPTGEADDRSHKPKRRLDEGEGVTIPPGQFGFILTKERIRVPRDAMALISIRSSYSFRGLVNVSGFHVDPNYNGRLLFSVFNAGPVAVHLEQGEPCFLIWYASLDEPGDVEPKEGYDHIPSCFTGPLAGGVESFARLKSKMDAIEREQALIKWASALALGALITLGVRSCTTAGSEMTRKAHSERLQAHVSTHSPYQPRPGGVNLHPGGPLK